MNQKDRIATFVEEIWNWYERHKRRLPWRDVKIKNDTQRAYMILVSEIMLQQTQVSRVIVIFRRFLEQFPTIQDLADASNKDVIMAWKGMGYNSRALRLRDAAKIVVQKYNGVFPREYDELISIKGIGPYTTAAIRNFAFNVPTPCIDTNIRRILHRTFVGPENTDGTWTMSDKDLLKIADQILEVATDKNSELRIPNSELQRNAAEWHAALMDYGSMVQTKSNPKWEICVLTMAGVMKTTKRNYELGMRNSELAKKEKSTKSEPGRFVGAKYIPNRIFRGRIVDALRENPTGLTMENIGKEIAVDWSVELEHWLKNLITKLVQEQIIEKRKDRYTLG